MDEHGHIRTQFDDLIDGIKKGNGKPVSVHVLAAASGLSAKDVRKWVEILEKDGKVRMHNSIDAIYVSWVDTSASPFEPGFAPRAETKLEVATPVDVDTLAISQGRGPASENDILIAQHHEERAKIAKPVSPGEAHQNVDADSDVVDKNGQMHKIDSLISSYRKNAQVEPAIRPQAPAKASAKEADELLSRIEMDISKPEEAGRLEEEEPEFSIPSNAYDSEEPRFTAEKIQLPKPEIRKAERLQPSIEKIEAQGPVRIAGVPVQFSERLAKHLKRIEAQTEKIKALRGEKEKLLNEQYVPIQRKLESELETVGDRILQMEKNIMEMQKRAIGIPEKIGAVDKMHMSTLKAHDEIRRAYDEASALIEESNGVLSNERDKIESILEKGRQEIAQHRAKTNELQSTLQRISEMEEESANKVVIAREALADQATQLAAAEKYSSDLRSLKTEIQDNINGLKASVSATKSVLGDIEKQMGQMRQIESWSDSIREDYNKRIAELDEYIRDGNHEFETLRESVESNFVRKYLKELRSITNSYEYEFNEAKLTEKGLDQRIAEEKARLEELFEEGKRISHIFESQASAPEGAGKFDARKETFESLSDLSKKRGQVVELIAEVSNKKIEAPVERSQPVHSQKAAPSKKSKPAKKGRR